MTLSIRHPIIFGWRPISTAPKDGTIIDLWAVNKVSACSKRFCDCSWSTHWDIWLGLPLNQTDWVATHWMPRPDPPEDGAGQMAGETALREALAWYGVRAETMSENQACNLYIFGHAESELTKDAGKRARAALANRENKYD